MTDRLPVTRRGVLSAGAAGLGLAATGSPGSLRRDPSDARRFTDVDLPGLRDAFFHLRDSGDVDFALVYAERVDDLWGSVGGPDLFSFPDDRPDVGDVDVDNSFPVPWGTRHSTNRSAREFAEAIGHGGRRGALETLDAQGRAFENSGEPTLGLTEGTGNRQNYALTGRIPDAVPPASNYAVGDEAPIPQIDYVGGPFATRGGGVRSTVPPNVAHLQSYDGFLFNMPTISPATNRRIERAGEYSGPPTGFPRPLEFGGSTTLSPGFGHVLDPALATLSSNAAQRAHANAKLYQLASQSATDIYQDVKEDALQGILRGATYIGPGVPTGIAGGAVFLLTNVALPVAGALIGTAIAPGVGTQIGFAVADTVAFAIDTLYMVYATGSALYSTAGTVADAFVGSRNNRLFRPLRDPAYEGPDADTMSVLAGAQANAATQALALGVGGAATYRHYLELLEAQRTIAEEYRIHFDTDVFYTEAIAENLSETARKLKSYYLTIERKVEREKRLLQAVNFNRSDVSLASAPDEAEVGKPASFTVSEPTVPYGSVEGYRWGVYGPYGGAGGGGGGRFDGGGGGRGDDYEEQFFTDRADREFEHTFESSGRHTVEGLVRVSNDLSKEGNATAVGAATRVVVDASVTANAAIADDYDADALPPETDVAFTGEGSASGARGGSIDSYEWYRRPQGTRVGADGEPEREAYEWGDPVDTGERATIRFPESGGYEVRLRVSEDRGGETFTDEVVMEVTAFGDEGVVADFDYPEDPLDTGVEVTFDAGPSRTPFEGEFDVYEWNVTPTDLTSPGVDAPEGPEGTDSTLSYTFDRAADYWVTLAVEDGRGGTTYTDQKTVTVEVIDRSSGDGGEDDPGDGEDDPGDGGEDPPPTGILVDVDGDPRVGERVGFEITVDGAAWTGVTWRFRGPDGRTSETVVSAGRVSRDFDRAGTWRVHAEVETTEGQTEAAREVVVSDLPAGEATDPDGDGDYEDVDGDGEATFEDVVTLEDNLETRAIQSEADRYDFDGDGDVDADDVSELLAEVADDAGGDDGGDGDGGEGE